MHYAYIGTVSPRGGGEARVPKKVFVKNYIFERFTLKEASDTQWVGTVNFMN